MFPKLGKNGGGAPGEGERKREVTGKGRVAAVGLANLKRCRLWRLPLRLWRVLSSLLDVSRLKAPSPPCSRLRLHAGPSRPVNLGSCSPLMLLELRGIRGLQGASGEGDLGRGVERPRGPWWMARMERRLSAQLRHHHCSQGGKERRGGRPHWQGPGSAR